MLSVCNAVPTFPLYQPHEPFPYGSWGQPQLPSIGSVFMQQAPSPGALSYETDSNISDHLALMEDDLPSPSPSEVSMVPGDDGAKCYTDMDMEGEIDELFDVIRQEIEQERTTVCQCINIGPDPYQWSIEEVDRWIRWNHQKYGLTDINMDYFHMDGYSLCNLTEEEFRQRAPKAGDVIYSHLDIWKTAARPTWPQPQITQPQPMLEIPVPQLPGFSFDLSNIKTEPQQDVDIDAASVVSSSSSDEQSIPSPSQCGSGPDTSMTPNHTGSIHLWQFLKELLLQPDSYGYCIRWLDRPQGIFKIEDSVKVANLWGRRKNRPAMNYDKMSRSIRQYYKKGIMKKTEVSQRLVYQFVKPPVDN